MKYVRCAAALLVVWGVWSMAGADVSTLPASVPATASTAPAPSAETLAREIRARAYKQLLSGRFRAGLDLLGESLKHETDEATAGARALTAAYLKVGEGAEAERRSELAAAVARVELARVAEKSRPKRFVHQAGAKSPEPTAGKEKADKDLFELAGAIADAVWAINRDLVANSTSSQPADVLKSVGEKFDRAVEALSAADKLVGVCPGGWGQAFHKTAEQLRRAMAAYRAAWQTAGLPEDRPMLKAAAEKVQDLLLDVGVLVSRDPLVAALAYAREAEELTAEKDTFLRQEWVGRLIRDAENRGRQLVSKGQWIGALRIYGHAGLSDLDKDNPDYQGAVKRISHHVRVLQLYDQAPTTQPAPGRSGTRWWEMIAGIDARMVRNAVSQIDYNYVETPDYRKIGVAAMDALKVLAETPEAARAFPVLKDQAKCSAFLKGLDRQIAQLNGKSTVDYLHVKSALNRVLDLNDETLNLPPEVVNMEFAEGMTGELDRFTSVVWPYEMPVFNKRTMGSFHGIGVQIRKDPGKPIEVVTPLADTPAFRARIQAGDLILRVDGKDVGTVSISRAVKLITGPRHTNVTLTIQRRGVAKPFETTIERDEIRIKTVKGWRRLRDGGWDYFLDRRARIAYVRVEQFTSSTAGDLRAVLGDLRRAGTSGVIIDLRLNPGGLLNAAVAVANEFLSRGLIVRTKGRNVRETKRSASPLGAYQKGPLVVLVNHVSASAAEIVSGALKDWGRAIVVGERTYGKASVQRLLPVRSNEAMLKLTTAYYYLPSGKALHRTNGAKAWGVDPDVPVRVTRRQMGRWLEIRQETDLLKTVVPKTLDSLLSQQLDADIQLQTALLLVRLRLLSRAA